MLKNYVKESVVSITTNTSMNTCLNSDSLQNHSISLNTGLNPLLHIHTIMHKPSIPYKLPVHTQNFKQSTCINPELHTSYLFTSCHCTQTTCINPALHPHTTCISPASHTNYLHKLSISHKLRV